MTLLEAVGLDPSVLLTVSILLFAAGLWAVLKQWAIERDDIGLWDAADFGAAITTGVIWIPLQRVVISGWSQMTTVNPLGLSIQRAANLTYFLWVAFFCATIALDKWDGRPRGPCVNERVVRAHMRYVPFVEPRETDT